MGTRVQSPPLPFCPVDALLDLAEPWLYILVFLLAAAEGAALVGLVLPGETSMLVAGLVVYRGDADGLLVYLCGVLGAVIGDSVGYWIGRRFGPRLRASRLGRKVGPERWERARSYLHERGGRAVFVGRFAGFLRTLVPPVAGQAEMPYRRFFAFNAPAAALWAVVFISLGLVGAESWHTVEAWAGRASAFVAVLAIGVAAVILGARWLQGHKATVLRLWRAVVDAPVVRSFRRRFASQIAFIERRLDPKERFGLLLTIGVGVAVLSGIAFEEVIEAARADDDLGRIDGTVASFAAEHQSDALDDVVQGLTSVFNSGVLAVAIAGVGVAMSFVRHRAVWLSFAVVAVVGALVLDDLVMGALRLFRLPSPPQPLSGELLALVVFAGSLVFLAATLWGWRAGVWAGAAGLGLILVASVAFAYEGTLVSTQLGGLLLGFVWLAVCGTGASQLEHLFAREGSARRDLEDQ